MHAPALFAHITHAFGNALAMTVQDLRGTPAHVERDADGVPTAWRIFGYGPVRITRDGRTLEGEFTPHHAAEIVAHFRRKGTPIPLDSRHFTFRLAESLGVDETDIIDLLKTDSATFGFAALEARDDGLWLTGAEYHPLARRLIAEGTLRYFSPVLRGLAAGPLRLTSMTFTNTPATDGQLAIAADAEPALPYSDIDSLAASLDALRASATQSRAKPKEAQMDKLLNAIAALTGRDAIALSDDGTVPDDIIDALSTLTTELGALRGARNDAGAFLAAVRAPLALADDAPLTHVEGAVLALAEKAKTADDLRARVDALAAEAEGRRHRELVDRGLSEGKLTEDMAANWAAKQDAAALEAFLQHAPRVVPVNLSLDRGALPRADAVALTAEDRQIAAQCGITEEDMLKGKQALARQRTAA